jgi:hypothetical protein
MVPWLEKFFLLHAHTQKPDRVGASFGFAVTLEREFDWCWRGTSNETRLCSMLMTVYRKGGWLCGVF